MPKKEEPHKKDLHLDYAAGVGMPQGHWDAFMMHCAKHHVSHKAAITRMIEQFVDKQFLDIVYGPDKWRG